MNVKDNDLNNKIRILSTLIANYESVFYIPYKEDPEREEYEEYKESPDFTEFIMELYEENDGKLKRGKFGEVVLYENDCKALREESKKSVIIPKLEKENICYAFFRAYYKGTLHYYKIKYVADREDGVLKGTIVGLIDNGVIDKNKRQREFELYNALDEAERAVMEKTAELRDRTLVLSFANEEVVELLGNIVEFRNRESGLHVKRVKTFTKVLAEQLREDYPEYGLNEELIDCITSASSLHDVGKISIPDVILLKQDSLTTEETEIMQKHCEYGVEILHSAPSSWSAQYLKTAIDICYCHHEKWDGGGYPRGLKGDEIPISAQIVSIADCYDALTTERAYKAAYSPEEAYKMIMNGECGAFSDKILSCLKKCRTQFKKIVADPTNFLERVSVQLNGDNKLNGLKVLLVDDNEMSLEINSDILESEGAEVITAENGMQAIELFINKSPFDAIIMDVVMPGMSGIEASKRIRKLESDRDRRTPIIALTAEGMSYNTLVEAGIDASMAKPLVVGEFIRILISYMQTSSEKMQNQLTETKKIANTDTLTKVKNVSAYSDMRSILNNEIKENPDLEFAIVFCDINGLKKVNDTYGHEVGNTYIQNGCRILSEVYTQSPVYRVGGDEFIVVLQGSDYKNREEKFKLLHERVKEAEKVTRFEDGKTSFSAGMSDYNPKTDSDVRDVQGRADAYMYHEKGNKRR